jgi:hypothetical protein
MLTTSSVNYLDFTPEHFTINRLFARKQIAWIEIEPNSFGYIAHTFYFFTLFTSIGFRLKPDSPHYNAFRRLVSANSGFHLYFMHLFKMDRDELIETFRRYQEKYGGDSESSTG